MSKKSSPSAPAAPSLYTDPFVQRSQQGLFDQSNFLLGGDYSSNPYLSSLVNFNPEVTQLALQNIQGLLAPSFRDSRQDIINQLEANNQLTGSTTASALGNIQSDYESRLLATTAQAGLADIDRAQQSKLSLYGLGFGGLGTVGQLGLSNQGQVNEFNLNNYQNILAQNAMNQKSKRGGLLGGLTGAIGGGLGGFALGGPIGAGIGAIGGGLLGATGPSGTGGQFLGAGAGLAGQYMGRPSVSIFDQRNNPYSLGGRSIYPGVSGLAGSLGG